MILLFLWLVEVAGKSVELGLPEASVTGEERSGIFHGSSNQAAAADSAVLLPPKEPGAFQYSEMFRDGGKRDVERFRQRRHRGFPAGQSRQDRPAGRVRQSRKGCVQGSLIVNHKVKYNGRPVAVKRKLALPGLVLVSYRPQDVLPWTVRRKGGDA